jgi:hypothetical protein
VGASFAGGGGVGAVEFGAGAGGTEDSCGGVAGAGAGAGAAEPDDEGDVSVAMPCAAASEGDPLAGSLGPAAVPAWAGVAGLFPPIGFTRNAVILPTSLTTNIRPPATTGALLMRTFPVPALAAMAPVALSNQCTYP